MDENLPAQLADDLSRLGHDTDTIPEEDLTGADDPRVWRAAQDTQRFLITQDLDFSDMRKFRPGTHHGILLVRLRRPTRRLLAERVRTLFETENAETWPGCFVVATESKLRTHRA